MKSDISCGFDSRLHWENRHGVKQLALGQNLVSQVVLLDSGKQAVVVSSLESRYYGLKVLHRPLI